ncbi:hypothetical protein LL969_15650 [Xanthomonas campestris pv. phormiicola]|nr:hypothetical protein [Xanthomonas campestris pv. phormiicola]
MADPHRHSSSRATAKPDAPLADDDAPGTSEARAWGRQLRAAVPRWLLPAVLSLGVGLGLLLWYARA